MCFDNFHLPTTIVSYPGTRWDLRVRARSGPQRGLSKQSFQVLNRACHGFRAGDGQTGSYVFTRTPTTLFPKSASRTSSRDLPEARLNEALAADAFACSVSAVCL